MYLGILLMLARIVWTLTFVTLLALVIWLHFGDDPLEDPVVWWDSAEPPRQDRPAHARPVVDQPLGNESLPNPAMMPGEQITEAAPQTAEVATIPEPTSADVDDLLRWYEQRGQILGFSDYDGYTKETLRALAEQGDIHALQLLAERLHEQGEHDPANAYLLEAAVHGSVHALDRLGAAHYAAMLRARNEGDEAAERRSALNALAWYETAYLRGDLNARSRVDGLMQNLGELEFNDNEIFNIRLRSEAHYRQLATRRAQLGYEEFDNTPHPVLKKYHDMYEAQSPRD
jgi:hypothetical protein